VSTSEIDGTVYLERNGEFREAANVALQLLDNENKTTDTLRSAYDGFFIFEKVVPGQYTLRVDPSKLERLGLEASEHVVTVTKESEILSEQDIILRNR